jgi:hypothetical protein
VLGVEDDGEAATSYRQHFNIAPTDQHFSIHCGFENVGVLGLSSFYNLDTPLYLTPGSVKRRYAWTFSPDAKKAVRELTKSN